MIVILGNIPPEKRYQEHNITRRQATFLLERFPILGVWNRLFVQDDASVEAQRYKRFYNNRDSRSGAFFAAEFVSSDGCAENVDVYYGKAMRILGHKFQNPKNHATECRIMVIAGWATRGIKLGCSIRYDKG